MVRFERSKRRRKGSPKDRFSKRRSRDEDSFEDRPRRRRDFGRSSRGRHDVEMTKVTCSSCGDECEVPFKPTSNKPVYCDNCFKKKGKNSSDKPSDRDLDIINEKLNKIMKALKIE